MSPKQLWLNLPCLRWVQPEFSLHDRIYFQSFRKSPGRFSL